ncbi:putative protein in type-1 R1DM retrotransposable element [Halotydeus destructor]|nr:putative protein in type-1 R1DM retrotransposable element [Halotydeus destructor]
MEANDIDIALFSEPYVGANGKVRRYRRYTTLQEVTSDLRVKTAILINNEAKLSFLLDTEHTNTNFTTVKITNSDQQLTLTSFYIEPDTEADLHLRHLNKILASFSGGRLICGGDSNALHPQWSEAGADNRGSSLVEVLEQYGMCVLNEGRKPTFDCIRGSRHLTSIIDITFASARASSNVSHWRVVEDAHATGDHNAILFESTQSLKKPMEQPTTYRWKTKNINWEDLQSDLAEHESCFRRLDFPEAEDVEAEIAKWTRKLQELCDDNLKRKKTGTNYKPFWNEELTGLKKEVLTSKRNLHRKVRTSGPEAEAKIYEEYHKLRSKYSEAIQNASAVHFKKFVSETANENVWDLHSKLLKQSTRTPASTLKIGEHYTSSSEETATALLKNFYPQDTEDSESQAALRRKSLRPATSADDLQFTVAEVLEAASTTHPTKAPGIDHLTGDICKLFIEEFPQQVTSLYNACLRLHYFPTSWKLARVKILPKPGKESYAELSSFRPIGLLPVLGKILEKLMKQRILHAIRPTMSKKQYGFTEQVSTVDALREATSVLRKSRASKDLVLGVSLDIKAAFDNAWWPMLRLQLLRKNCPANLLLLVDSYLRDRNLQLAYGDATSTVKMTKGCVQGSVCGPLFWNIILDSLLHQTLPLGCHLQAFADDLLLIVCGRSVDGVQRTAEAALRQISDWGRKVKLNFSAPKTQVVAFSPHLRGLHLRMGDQLLPPSPSFKILGVVIDQELKFCQHVKSVIKKATVAYKFINRIIRPTWGASAEIIRTIYLRAVEPIITYASSIWSSALNYKYVRKWLNSFQRPFTIAASKAFRTSSLTSTQAISFIMPLHLRIRELSELEAVKVSGSYTMEATSGDSTSGSSVLIDGRVPVSLLPHPADRQTINYSMATTQAAVDHLSQRTEQAIFTDGSKSEDGVGAAYAVFRGGSLRRRKQFKLGQHCTIMQAELLALREAVRLAISSEAETTIFSDSRSGLEALMKRGSTIRLVFETQELLLEAHLRRVSIKFVWVKAHNNIIGNELADAEAKAASTSEGPISWRKVPLSFAKYELRKKSLEAWNDEYLASAEVSSSEGKFHISHHIPSIMEAEKLRRSGFRPTLPLTQLLTGHAFSLAYMTRFKHRNSPLCPCNNEVQDVLHLLEECHFFASGRSAVQHLRLGASAEVGQMELFIDYATTIGNNLKRINEVADRPPPSQRSRH